MSWEIVYIKEARKDMKKLDPQSRKYVLKAIDKVSANPLPNAEDGYGKPLGNHRTAKLSGYMKIKLKDLGLRVVYGLVRENNVMKIIIVSIRDDDEVYLEAAERIRKLEEDKQIMIQKSQTGMFGTFFLEVIWQTITKKADWNIPHRQPMLPKVRLEQFRKNMQQISKKVI